jgi:guanosine-3',5'-bis(diphosphate) 3'-pyrophosphohydrolase
VNLVVDKGARNSYNIIMKTLVEKAKRFAHEAHDSIGQKRKYSGEPYWVHTDEVASIVAEVAVSPFDNNEAIIAAAHLHDVLEDVFPLNVKYNHNLIRDLFGFEVLDMVIDLTDAYTKEAYPNLNRAERKKRERERIANTSPASKTVKLADLISNTASIARDDKDFARVYLREKMALLPYLADGSPVLLQRASMQALGAMTELGLTIDTITR